MKLHIFIVLLIAAFAFASLSCSGESANAQPEAQAEKAPETIEELKLENLLRAELELVEGTEVIVSYIEVPGNFTLPKHWHPGEEFVYILEGEGTAWQKDKPDVVLKKGEVFKIPLKQIHTAKTGDSGFKALVFRVHQAGQPDRVLVEE